LKDYYTILGLDADATPDTIKLSYRRLAREAHPDRVSHLGDEAQSQASRRMAELNEAYSTLSDSLRRKDYDDEFKKWQAKQTMPAAEQDSGPVAIPMPEPEPEAPTVQRPAARPQPQVISNVVGQFSTQLQTRLVQASGGFAWRGTRMEGFDWAMKSSFLLADYYVALRGFAIADPTAASKLMNYAAAAMERTRKLVKRNYFVLLMPFQKMRDPEQVLASCRRFAGESGQGRLTGAQTQVVLMDVTHGRTVPCGPRIEDKRFEELMQHLGLAK
jgi:curved DNA-binding protein CbpA